MMAYTEEEARGKWCPMARVAVEGSCGLVSAGR